MGSEVLGKTLADKKMAHVLMTPADEHQVAERTRLSRGEWLGIHAVAFLILSWNLFAVDAARTPGRWWFWMPVAALAAVLAVHAAWMMLIARRSPAAGASGGLTREADAR